MQKARLDKTIREMLVGHSTGLDRVYYKAQDEEIFEEFLKAVDLLTISDENRLRRQADSFRKKSQDVKEIRQQFKDDWDKKMQEMEDKFQQIISTININALRN